MTWLTNYKCLMWGAMPLAYQTYNLFLGNDLNTWYSSKLYTTCPEAYPAAFTCKVHTRVQSKEYTLESHHLQMRSTRPHVLFLVLLPRLRGSAPGIKCGVCCWSLPSPLIYFCLSAAWLIATYFIFIWGKAFDALLYFVIRQCGADGVGVLL